MIITMLHDVLNDLDTDTTQVHFWKREWQKVYNEPRKLDKGSKVSFVEKYTCVYDIQLTKEESTQSMCKRN